MMESSSVRVRRDGKPEPRRRRAVLWSQRTAVQLAVLSFLVVGTASGRAKEVSSWSARLYEEILTPWETGWTRGHDVADPTSHQIDKRGLLAALPARVRARGEKLRALLVLGPFGTAPRYRILAFIEERGHTEVIETAISRGRIQWKGSGLISPSRFARLERVFRSSSILSPVATAADLPGGPHSDDRYTLLFADLDKAAPFLAFGDLLHARDQRALRALIRRIDDVEQPLYQSYSTHWRRDAIPVALRSGEAFGVAVTLARDVPRELDHDLERAGYSTLATTRLQLGPEVASWRNRWIVRTSFRLGTSRTARGPEGARFTLSQWGVDITGGYAVLDTQNLAVFPALGLGMQQANAGMDPRALPLFKAHFSGLRHRIHISQDSFTLGASLGSDYFVPFSRRPGSRWGLIFGTRLGYAFGFPSAWSDSNGSLDGGPRISGSGPFARFWVGIGTQVVISPPFVPTLPAKSRFHL